MNTTLTINSRFNGPPNSGNGGYVCGIVADYVKGAVEVTLRKPLSLDKAVTILTIRKGEGVQLLDGETLLAEGRPSTLELETPIPPSLGEAKTAVNNYAGFHNHIFPTCFVCGPQRPDQDGLQIYPGRPEGYNLVAAPWMPTPDLGDENGRVLPRYVWAALDCPGAFAIMEAAPKPVVLGRLTACLTEPPVFVGQEYIVIGWHIEQDGRKQYAGTAVYTPDHQLCALAQATWIELSTNQN